ncbi:hypothetical protein C1H46_042172 [Malus baccata]|uniref:Protein kinase domain-containing protein n=1 Tax=Malus baccata TaxID=106549 RepID=A0A540KDV0_MALBA|nr:hypothetical protein C1H46_042172 [Malus baccata]
MQVRNEKARRYLTSMRKKQPVCFAQKFPNADPLALRLLERLLAFDPKDRPTAEQALADPYFKGLSRIEREPLCQPITKMEFEFERRRVTKEDIRELIFREILEYHPQLLKDYINGTERTNFLYPSAVDQFRKQFAHLEENGGKSGPVIPLERKHTSLPSARIPSAYDLHCSSIPGKASAKPGRVVGPVAQYDNRNMMKDAYDRRTLVGGSVLLPQAAPPAYCYRKPSAGNQERSVMEVDRDMSSQAKQAAHCGMAAKVAPDVAITIDSNPFFMTRVGVPKVENDDRIAIDTNYLQTKAPYGGIGAAAATAAAHRKVGTVQFGMSRMY